MTPVAVPAPRWLEVVALDWPEIGAGADLAGLLQAAGLQDGDIVVLTSKVVSKAEGQRRYGDRRDLVAEETRRVLARRGDFVVAETRHGLVMAAAGVDGSNTPAGTVLALPLDPDATARRLRAELADGGSNVAVLVTDTAGRPWRTGQTDMAIGCAGLAPLVDLIGTADTHGNVLVVTAPAVGDEIAAAADLVKGKATGRPVALVRGLADWVLPTGDHGPGAAALIRPSDLDLFGLGAREAAVAAALRHDPVALEHFPPVIEPGLEPFAGLVAATDAAADGAGAAISVTRLAGDGPLPGWLVQVDVPADASAADLVAAGRLMERAAVVAAAHRLRGREAPGAGAPGRSVIYRVAFAAEPADVKGSSA